MHVLGSLASVLYSTLSADEALGQEQHTVVRAPYNPILLIVLSSYLSINNYHPYLSRFPRWHIFMVYNRCCRRSLLGFQVWVD